MAETNLPMYENRMKKYCNINIRIVPIVVVEIQY